MGRFSGPAPKKADRQLYRQPRTGLGRFQQQVRKELRQNAREEYWAAKLRTEQQAKESAE